MHDFNHILDEMIAHGMSVPSEKVRFSIRDADGVLRGALAYFVRLIDNREAEWLPEYDQVAEWLNDNDGRGLFLFGTCGRGKTVLARFVIPSILLKHERKVVSYFDAQQMNANIDDVLQKKILCIDDVGTEDVLVSYGNKRLTFLEVMDAAEKYGKLIIATSNLNHEQLIEKYGDRTMDRIIATTKRVLFTGKSLRK